MSEKIESAREFVERLPWMSLNEEPDLEQWANHVRYRDAAIRAECAERAIAWYTKDAGPELLPMYQSRELFPWRMVGCLECLKAKKIGRNINNSWPA